MTRPWVRSVLFVEARQPPRRCSGSVRALRTAVAVTTGCSWRTLSAQGRHLGRVVGLSRRRKQYLPRKWCFFCIPRVGETHTTVLFSMLRRWRWGCCLSIEKSPLSSPPATRGAGIQGQEVWKAATRRQRRLLISRFHIQVDRSSPPPLLLGQLLEALRDGNGRYTGLLPATSSLACGLSSRWWVEAKRFPRMGSYLMLIFSVWSASPVPFFLRPMVASPPREADSARSEWPELSRKVVAWPIHPPLCLSLIELTRRNSVVEPLSRRRSVFISPAPKLFRCIYSKCICSTWFPWVSRFTRCSSPTIQLTSPSFLLCCIDYGVVSVTQLSARTVR